MAFRVSGQIRINDDGDVNSGIITASELLDGKVSDKAITEQTDGSIGDVTGADELLLHDEATGNLLRVTVDEFVGGAGIGTIVTDFDNLAVGSGGSMTSPAFYGGTYYGDGSGLNNLPGSAIVGSLTMMPANSIPTNHLECDGSALDTTVFSELFAVIGYTYGGSGSTFNLPDFRGQFLRGLDSGAGVDPSRTLGSVQDDEINSADLEAGLQVFMSQGGSFGLNSIDGSNGTAVGGASWNSNLVRFNATGTETRPTNYAVIYCIRYQ